MNRHSLQVNDEVTALVTVNPNANNPAFRLNLKPDFVDNEAGVESGHAMRIYRIENFNGNKLAEGEMWTARVKYVKVATDMPKTKDDRTKIIVTIDLVRREEVTRYVRFDSKNATVVREVTSGSVTLKEELLHTASREATYRYDQGVIKVREITANGDHICYMHPVFYTDEEYLQDQFEFSGRKTSNKDLKKHLEALEPMPKLLVDHFIPNDLRAA